MNRILVMLRCIVSLCAFAVPALAIAAGSDNPCANAGGQQVMNACISDAVKKKNVALNQLYDALTGKLDDLGKRNLVAAERAWISFRDRECSFRAGYDNEHLENNGTIAPYLVGECLLDLTDQRIADFRAQMKCPGGDMSCEN